MNVFQRKWATGRVADIHGFVYYKKCLNLYLIFVRLKAVGVYAVLIEQY